MINLYNEFTLRSLTNYTTSDYITYVYGYSFGKLVFFSFHAKKGFPDQCRAVENVPVALISTAGTAFCLNGEDFDNLCCCYITGDLIQIRCDTPTTGSNGVLFTIIYFTI